MIMLPRDSDPSSTDDDDSILNESSSTASERDTGRRPSNRRRAAESTVPNSSESNSESPAHRPQPYRYHLPPPILSGIVNSAGNNHADSTPPLPPRIVGLHEPGSRSSVASNHLSASTGQSGRRSTIQSQPLPPPPPLPSSKDSSSAVAAAAAAAVVGGGHVEKKVSQSTQAQLLKQYQMNLPSPAKSNGQAVGNREESRQDSRISQNMMIESPPERPPERTSSKIDTNKSNHGIAHLNEIFQNLPPPSGYGSEDNDGDKNSQTDAQTGEF